MATARTLSERVCTLNIIPLVKSHNPTFTDWYTLGLGWSLFGQREENGPCEENYLLWMFEQCRIRHAFHPQHEQLLCSSIGFALGMIHGGVLLPNATLRPDTTTLVTLSNQNTIQGYQAGREFFFTDADEEEDWHLSDERLFAWLRELAEQDTSSHNALGTVRFALGTILGELSGHLFPWTPDEQQACDAECVRILGYVSILKPTCLAAHQFAGAMVS